MNAEINPVSEIRARQSLGISGGRRYYEWAVKGLEAEIERSGAILDLGCGTGLFGSYLTERFGQRPYGMDVVRHEGFAEESYVAFELRDLSRSETGDGALATAKFDLIFALGLIEYLPDPRAFLRATQPMLSPNGRLVVTAPNPASLRSLVALAVRGEFSAFRESSNPASITPVLAVDAARMLRELGYAEVTVDFSGSGRAPFFSSARYQSVLPLLRGRLWSDDFRCVAAQT